MKRFRSGSRMKPRVVRAIARLNVGGPALHVTYLTAGLADRYPTVLVAGAVAPGEADMSAWAREQGVDVHTIPQLGRSIRPWDDLLVFMKLFRLFRRLRPDIVHTHTAKAGTLGRLAAVLARVPVRVHTFHGHVFRGYFGKNTTRLVLWTERFLARFTTCVVAISESQADEIVDQFRICSRKRVRVIPLGLDLARFDVSRLRGLRGELRSEIGAGSDPIVSIVGRLVPIKNHKLFLHAAARLRDAGRACTFAVVGGGGEEGRLRALAAELGIEDRVRFLGWRSDLDRIYADSDVVALTSHNEGTPVCLIEALAAGCAVAATDVGGVREVLEDGRLGLVVPPGDPGAMAAAVATLLGDSTARREMGAAGMRAIPARFGVQRLLADVAALYDQLLGHSASDPSRSTPTPKASACTT